VLATLDVNGAAGPSTTLAALNSYVEHECDAWEWACQFAERYLADPAPGHLDAFLPWVSLLAERTAELHHTLLSATSDPAFKAEPMTPFVRRSFYQGIRQDLTETLRALAAQRSFHDAWTETLAKQVLDRRSVLAQRAEAVLDAPLNRSRSRIHGDYHLGQVLFTGSDFVLIDFEGEPRRRLSERRLKSLPVRDVAGMVRSLHYAAFSAVGRPDAQQSAIGAHARQWYQTVSGHFIAAYQRALPMATSPGDPWLKAFLLEKAAYEARYELAHRPDWAWLPLMGLLELADTEAEGGSHDQR
jgi:maltose alpha-D-glucosyltransferase/alpha-amylase